MTVMEANESDEYLKTVCAPQLLKFFNICNQIHSMYQLMQLQYTSYLAWTSCNAPINVKPEGGGVGQPTGI